MQGHIRKPEELVQYQYEVQNDTQLPFIITSTTFVPQTISSVVPVPATGTSSIAACNAPSVTSPLSESHPLPLASDLSDERANKRQKLDDGGATTASLVVVTSPEQPTEAAPIPSQATSPSRVPSPRSSTTSHTIHRFPRKRSKKSRLIEGSKRRYYNSCHICKCAATDGLEHARCNCGVIFCSRQRCCKRMGMEFEEFKQSLADGAECPHCAFSHSDFNKNNCPNSNCQAKKKKGYESRRYCVSTAGQEGGGDAEEKETIEDGDDMFDDDGAEAADFDEPDADGAVAEDGEGLPQQQAPSNNGINFARRSPMWQIDTRDSSRQIDVSHSSSNNAERDTSRSKRSHHMQQQQQQPQQQQNGMRSDGRYSTSNTTSSKHAIPDASVPHSSGAVTRRASMAPMSNTAMTNVVSPRTSSATRASQHVTAPVLAHSDRSGASQGVMQQQQQQQRRQQVNTDSIESEMQEQQPQQQYNYSLDLLFLPPGNSTQTSGLQMYRDSTNPSLPPNYPSPDAGATTLPPPFLPSVPIASLPAGLRQFLRDSSDVLAQALPYYVPNYDAYDLYQFIVSHLQLPDAVCRHLMRSGLIGANFLSLTAFELIHTYGLHPVSHGREIQTLVAAAQSLQYHYEVCQFEAQTTLAQLNQKALSIHIPSVAAGNNNSNDNAPTRNGVETKRKVASSKSPSQKTNGLLHLSPTLEQQPAMNNNISMKSFGAVTSRNHSPHATRPVASAARQHTPPAASSDSFSPRNKPAAAVGSIGHTKPSTFGSSVTVISPASASRTANMITPLKVIPFEYSFAQFEQSQLAPSPTDESAQQHTIRSSSTNFTRNSSNIDSTSPTSPAALQQQRRSQQQQQQQQQQHQQQQGAQANIAMYATNVPSHARQLSTGAALNSGSPYNVNQSQHMQQFDFMTNKNSF